MECIFQGLVWLREQILHGGGPAWLEPAEVVPAPQPQPQDQQQGTYAIYLQVRICHDLGNECI